MRKEIDTYINSQYDWQRKNLETFRKLIHNLEFNVEEDWKWTVPVFKQKGKLLAAMSTFKNHTKFNFFEGASLNDKDGLFNSGLDSKKHRSINLKEGEAIDEAKLIVLIMQAIIKLQ